MIDPSADIVLKHQSLEYFLFKQLAEPLNLILVHEEDFTTRLEEITSKDLLIVWNYKDFAAANTGEFQLFVGASSIRDPGGIQRRDLLNSIKHTLDITAGIPVYQYQDGLPTEKVNELATVGPVRLWPAFQDPVIRFTTTFASQKLKFAQRRV